MTRFFVINVLFYPQSAFYPWSAVCSLHFTLSLHFSPGLHSTVCVLHWPITYSLMRVTAIKSHGNLHGEQITQSFCHRYILFTSRISRSYFMRKRKQHSTFHLKITLQVDPVCLHRTSHWEQSHAETGCLYSGNETVFCIRYFLAWW